MEGMGRRALIVISNDSRGNDDGIAFAGAPFSFRFPDRFSQYSVA